MIAWPQACLVEERPLISGTMPGRSFFSLFLPGQRLLTNDLSRWKDIYVCLKRLPASFRWINERKGGSLCRWNSSRYSSIFLASISIDVVLYLPSSGGEFFVSNSCCSPIQFFISSNLLFPPINRSFNGRWYRDIRSRCKCKFFAMKYRRKLRRGARISFPNRMQRLDL